MKDIVLPELYVRDQPWLTNLESNLTCLVPLVNLTYEIRLPILVGTKCSASQSAGNGVDTFHTDLSGWRDR